MASTRDGCEILGSGFQMLIRGDERERERKGMILARENRDDETTRRDPS